jgi:hypothetical protein
MNSRDRRLLLRIAAGMDPAFPALRNGVRIPAEGGSPGRVFLWATAVDGRYELLRRPASKLSLATSFASRLVFRISSWILGPMNGKLGGEGRVPFAPRAGPMQWVQRAPSGNINRGGREDEPA